MSMKGRRKDTPDLRCSMEKLHKCLENTIRIIWQWNKIVTELTSLESSEVVKGGKVTRRNKFFSYNNKKVIFSSLRIMKVISENTAPNVKQTHEPISLNECSAILLFSISQIQISRPQINYNQSSFLMVVGEHY